MIMIILFFIVIIVIALIIIIIIIIIITTTRIIIIVVVYIIIIIIIIIIIPPGGSSLPLELSCTTSASIKQRGKWYMFFRGRRETRVTRKGCKNHENLEKGYLNRYDHNSEVCV